MSKVWQTKPLGELLSFLTSGSRGWAKHYSDSGDIFLRIQNVGRNQMLLDDVAFVDAPDSAEARRTRVEPGDVLLSVTADLGRTGVVPEGIGRAYINQHLVILRVTGIHPPFLSAFLASPEGQKQVMGRNRHAVKAGLNFDDVRSFNIPLPPLAEQRRIAEVLDRAEALRAKRRAALAQLDSLIHSVFVDLFGHDSQSPVSASDKLHDHSNGWRWELLTDVARLATGHTPDRERPDYWNGNIPWISLTDIRDLDGTVVTKTLQNVTSLGIENSSSVELPAGTVCFSRTASIGFVTIMGSKMATSQDFVNWVPGPRLDSTYLMWALIRSRPQLRAISSGSTHKTIYVRVVEGFNALVPPIELQRDFARRVATVEKLKVAQRASLAEMDALFASLQHRAFRGEL